MITREVIEKVVNDLASEIQSINESMANLRAQTQKSIDHLISTMNDQIREHATNVFKKESQKEFAEKLLEATQEASEPMDPLDEEALIHVPELSN